MTSHESYLSTRHFGSLDGVRFLCITAVLWHHTPIWTSWASHPVLLARGHVGVDFFFVLSGFLITTLLLREESRDGRFSLRGFYWRRLLRIVPLYYLVVSLAAFNEIVLNGNTEALSLLPYYYLFLSNFLAVPDITFLDPTWSLAMEEQYYLVWPLLLLLMPYHIWRVMVLIGLILVNLAAAIGAFRLIGIYPIEFPPLRLAIEGTTYAPILMGSLAAILLNSPAGFRALARLFGARAAPLVCLCLLLAVLSVPGPLEGFPNLAVHGLMTAMIVSLVVREDNGLAPLFRWPPIMRIGEISYGIYLYHLFSRGIIAILFAWLGIENWWLFFLAYYGLSVLMATISFRTFETWFMSFRHRAAREVPAR